MRHQNEPPQLFPGDQPQPIANSLVNRHGQARRRKAGVQKPVIEGMTPCGVRGHADNEWRSILKIMVRSIIASPPTISMPCASPTFLTGEIRSAEF